MSDPRTLPILFGVVVDRSALVDQVVFRFFKVCRQLAAARLPLLAARLYLIEFVDAYDTCLLCLCFVVESALTVPTSTQDQEGCRGPVLGIV